MEFTAQIISQEPVCGDFFRIKMSVPETFARAVPGQFVHVRVTSGTDPLLRRPFSLNRVVREKTGWTAELLVRKIGRATELLARARAGDPLSVEGPLGNGFRVTGAMKTLVLVAGGYGVAPLFFLAERLRRLRKKRDVHVLVGARNKASLLCVEELRKLGVRVHTATDDGSMGHRGNIADYFAKWTEAKGFRKAGAAVFACGPHAMMKALAQTCIRTRIPCQVSLEELMGCGMGACLSCVCRIATKKKGRRRAPSFTFKRVCKDGPVFEGSSVIF